MGDRAVLLAQLLTCVMAVDQRQLPDGGRIAVGREHIRKHLRGAEIRLAGSDPVQSLLDERRAALREFPHGLFAGHLGEEPQRLDRQVVVLLLEAVPTLVGEREELGRAASPTRGRGARLTLLHRLLLGQGVQVAPDRGRGEIEPLGQRRSGLRTVDKQRPSDPLAGALLAGLCGLQSALVEFHNTIVTLFPQAIQRRQPLLAHWAATTCRTSPPHPDQQRSTDQPVGIPSRVGEASAATPT